MKNHIAERLICALFFRKIYKYIKDYNGSKYRTLIPSNEEK